MFGLVILTSGEKVTSSQGKEPKDLTDNLKLTVSLLKVNINVQRSTGDISWGDVRTFLDLKGFVDLDKTTKQLDEETAGLKSTYEDFMAQQDPLRFTVYILYSIKRYLYLRS